MKSFIFLIIVGILTGCGSAPVSQLPTKTITRTIQVERVPPANIESSAPKKADLDKRKKRLEIIRKTTSE